MKKVLLSLSVLFSAGAFAQVALTPADLNAYPTNAKEQAIVDQAKARIHKANQLSKKAGGPVSQYMSHSDVAENLFGPSLTNFISPIFQDSLVLQDFGTPEPVDNHGYGAVFDVYSESFAFDGLEYFARGVDGYTVDSVLIGGFYDRVNNKSTTHVGDTLIVDVVWGAPTASMYRQGLTWPAGTWTNQTAPYDIYPIAFSGDPAEGWAGDVTWSGKMTYKKALTPADTTIGYHAFYTNLQVPAGAVFGATARFKSGETYSGGETYFAGAGSTTTATMNSFRVLVAGPASAGDGDAYFFEEVAMGVSESYAGAGPLFSSSRYGTVASGYFLTQGASTTDWWLHVSGNSTVSLDENEVSNEIALYPNPTSGNVTLEIAQGGTYTIDVLNLVGQVVYSEQVSINGGEKLNRDFSSLTKGVYLINLNGEGISKTSKLTIK